MRTDPDEITLEPEQPGHEPFLFALYVSVRQEELALFNWPAEVRDNFLRQQFKAQQYFRLAHPQAQSWIILRRQQAIGRLILNREESEIRLLDIALMPEHRNQGIGSLLIQRLIRETSSPPRPFRLHVLKGHRAAVLYQRLGFKRIGGTELHDDLEAGAP